MPKFRFVILDARGRKRTGILRGPDRPQVESALRSKLCDIVELSELSPSGDPLDGTPAKGRAPKKLWARITGGAGVLILLLVTLWAWPSAKPIVPVQYHPVKLKVKGKLELADPQADIEEIKLFAVLKEIQLTQRAVISPDTGEFEADIDVESPVVPQTVRFVIDSAFSDLVVEKEFKIGAADSLDVGTVTADRPHKKS